MEDYEYLEKQLEAKANEGAKDANGESSHKHKDRVDGSDRRRSRSKGDRRSRSRGRRSRSRDRRRRSRSRDRHRDRDYHRRSRSRDRHDRRDDYRSRGSGGYGGGGDYGRRTRDRTPPEERLAREKEKELKEMERATRTVFASNIHPKADERAIFEFFTKAGTVQDIQLITDKNTRRSRGMAYIEFATQEEVVAALTMLNGQMFMNMPVMLKTSEVEKNLAWEAQQQVKQQQSNAEAASNLMSGLGGGMAGVPAGLGSCRLEVRNLHEALADVDLKEAFEQFGFLELVQLMRDPAGQGPSSGIVQYREFADGVRAMQHMNGKMLGGKMLEVQMAPVAAAPGAAPVPDLTSMLAAGGGLPAPPAIDPAAAAMLAAQGIGMPAGVAMPGMPGLPGPPPGPPPVGAAAAAAQPPTAGGEEGGEEGVDDEGKGGMKMDAQRRAALMQRLAAGAGVEVPSATLPVAPAAPPPVAPPQPQVASAVMLDQGMLGPASPIPTQCILLKNMFDPQEEESRGDPNWVAEVESDVREECARFGQVLHNHVDRNSKGFAYVKFAAVTGAEAAHRALNLRWYSGKQIVVEYQFVHSYNGVFGLA